MSESEDIEAAVAKGVITRAQADAIGELARKRSGTTAQYSSGEEGRFRLLGGFNDVFLFIGVSLFACGLLAAVLTSTTLYWLNDQSEDKRDTWAFLDRRIADLNWRTRFGALVLAGFATLALVLGAAGIYAVVSYTVGQRRAEIGLRIALGARGADVVAMVLGSGLRLVGVGIAVGTLASLGATRVLQGQLYGVAPGDPGTLVAVGVLLTAVAVAACVLPALRASRVDPQVVLRG